MCVLYHNCLKPGQCSQTTCRNVKGAGFLEDNWKALYACHMTETFHSSICTCGSAIQLLPYLLSTHSPHLQESQKCQGLNTLSIPLSRAALSHDRQELVHQCFNSLNSWVGKLGGVSSTISQSSPAQWNHSCPYWQPAPSPSLTLLASFPSPLPHLPEKLFASNSLPQDLPLEGPELSIHPSIIY